MNHQAVYCGICWAIYLITSMIVFWLACAFSLLAGPWAWWMSYAAVAAYCPYYWWRITRDVVG